MIRKVLSMLGEGSASLGEIATSLGLTESQLKGRLELMVRMGYLERLTVDGAPGDVQPECPGCLLAGICRDETCSREGLVVGYRLSRKGMRVAGGRRGEDKSKSQEADGDDAPGPGGPGGVGGQ